MNAANLILFDLFALTEYFVTRTKITIFYIIQFSPVFLSGLIWILTVVHSRRKGTLFWTEWWQIPAE